MPNSSATQKLTVVYAGGAGEMGKAEISWDTKVKSKHSSFPSSSQGFAQTKRQLAAKVVVLLMLLKTINPRQRQRQIFMCGMISCGLRTLSIILHHQDSMLKTHKPIQTATWLVAEWVQVLRDYEQG